ncbi:AraC family transcriptional regulator [Ahniella affigens]|uniref:AraC family transcriptional regulator n=1 Tax=Ahniella affigens TaxID=2021234 RepID=A0A2P1PQF6_9GAMM|nr:AraC family transcriptional regulator [Ahniella affigens]AVP97062.1 AraC family transcriptional regulator [Ahniella affigens]
MSEPIDRLSALFERFRVRASLFHSGKLCDLVRFDAEPGRGFLHVLRAGELELSHPGERGRVRVNEPSLIFYPRAKAHVFHEAPAEGLDLVCATIAFAGGDTHPVARALPPCVVLPLRYVPDLSATLALLFAESEPGRCGQRLLLDRLFEVLLLQLLRHLLNHPDEAGLPPGMLAGLSEPRLARVLTALHEAPEQAWSLARMAAMAGMSRTAFINTFRDHLAQTPVDYLAALRVQLAQQRLLAGEPVKRIADDLGYSSASAFTRAFTSTTGHAPRHWLQQQRA